MCIESLMDEIVSCVKGVAGVKAIVLGGSRARGTHSPSSDIDLGIYYDPLKPLDLDELSRVAEHIDDEHRKGLVTPIRGWGPWINGGGWLKVKSQAVDFLYRDLAQVEAIITDCLDGRVDIAYQPGHPFGFPTSIYLGEVAVCQSLWDPHGVLQALKDRVIPYPKPLRTATIEKFAWEINFSIDIARKSVEKADVSYACGCCFRSVMCMLQVLFALNREYWLNEKGAVAIASRFAIQPAQFQERVNRVFSLLQPAASSIQEALHILGDLSLEIDRLRAM